MKRDDQHTFFLGLDLGQQQDYTALTILRQMPHPDEDPKAIMATRHVYHVQHAERFPLGTPYHKIASRIRTMQATPELEPHRQTVVVDTTGVGLPVFEMLEREGVRGLRGVTITGGNAPTKDGKIHKVPKRDLISTVQVLFQNGHLRIASKLQHAETLQRELQAFKVKINIATGHDQYEAWRERDHDDLVLSLAIAAWYAEAGRPRFSYGFG